MKIQRVILQPGYILHSRYYRETSLLVEAWTQEYGRISLIARGARKSRRGLLQAFTPLLISWVGKTELYTLSQVEADIGAHYLPGNKLLCGLYINELLLRLLQREDPHPDLYNAYQRLLISLSSSLEPQVVLRLFEKYLLQELGYAFSLTHDYQTNECIIENNYYRFEPSRGLTKTMDHAPGTFCGKTLLALATGKFEDALSLRESKHLMRLALSLLLGDKPLKSRELFIS